MRELIPGFRCAPSGLQFHAHVIAPVLCPAWSEPVIPVPSSPSGRAERLGESRALGRPHERPRQACHPGAHMPTSRVDTRAPGCLRLSPGLAYGRGPALATGPGPGSSFRPRSARGWILSACCMSPGIVALVDTCLVRADCRPDMHLDRPPVLPAFCRPVPQAPGRSIRKP